MRALVVGCDGQLGTEVVDVLRRDGAEVVGLDRPEIDIADGDSVASAFSLAQPDVVVNCAAWTAVDAAEEHEQDALRANGIGPAVLAQACAATDAWLVHLSTDYVFDGVARTPYAEDAVPAPRTAYGRTKLAGEAAVRVALPDRHYIVRTAWLYGLRGENFVKTMLRLEAERDTIDVVDDQRGQPTYARDLAEQLAMLVARRPPAATFHGTNSGQTTWYQLAREIFRLAGADPLRVRPTTSAQFVRPAQRPAFSVLGHAGWARAGMPSMRPWHDALVAAFADGFAAQAAAREPAVVATSTTTQP